MGDGRIVLGSCSILVSSGLALHTLGRENFTRAPSTDLHVLQMSPTGGEFEVHKCLGHQSLLYPLVRVGYSPKVTNKVLKEKTL